MYRSKRAFPSHGELKYRIDVYNRYINGNVDMSGASNYGDALKVANIPCKLVTFQPSAYFDGAQVSSATTHRFYFREGFCEDIDMSHKILYNNTWFDINSVERIEEIKRWIMVNATERGPDSLESTSW